MLRKYDYRCSEGHVFERTVDSECPRQLCFCGNSAEVIWRKFPGTLAHSNARRFDPVTVFRKPDGTYALPGRSNDPTPAGMQRVELTSASAVRRFEKEENSRVKHIKEESLEREDRMFTPFKKQRREALKKKMETFSGLGRQFAEVAMKKSDERPSLSEKACKFDPNFHVQAFSMDAGNRLPFNDVDTGLKDKK